MLLSHARTLAVAEVTRGGVKFPKGGPFPKEQLAAEDWEPVAVVPEPVAKTEDCGCDGKAAQK